MLTEKQLLIIMIFCGFITLYLLGLLIGERIQLFQSNPDFYSCFRGCDIK